MLKVPNAVCHGAAAAAIRGTRLLVTARLEYFLGFSPHTRLNNLVFGAFGVEEQSLELYERLRADNTC